MNKLDEFNTLIRQTDIMRQVIHSMEQEPLKLLIDICKKQEQTGMPVPDHSLHIHGYIVDIALKALIESGLVKRMDGGRISLYSFEPTTTGLQFYTELRSKK